jgi:hypothetical protein
MPPNVFDRWKQAQHVTAHWGSDWEASGSKQSNNSQLKQNMSSQFQGLAVCLANPWLTRCPPMPLPPPQALKTRAV